MTDEERLADAIARTRDMSSIDANLIEDALDDLCRERDAARDKAFAFDLMQERLDAACVERDLARATCADCEEECRELRAQVAALKAECDAAYARGAADMREAIAAEVEKVTPRTAKAIRALPLPQNQSAAGLAAHQVIASNRK